MPKPSKTILNSERAKGSSNLMLQALLERLKEAKLDLDDFDQVQILMAEGEATLIVVRAYNILNNVRVYAENEKGKLKRMK